MKIVSLDSSILNNAHHIAQAARNLSRQNETVLVAVPAAEWFNTMLECSFQGNGYRARSADLLELWSKLHTDFKILANTCLKGKEALHDVLAEAEAAYLMLKERMEHKESATHFRLMRQAVERWFTLLFYSVLIQHNKQVELLQAEDALHCDPFSGLDLYNSASALKGALDHYANADLFVFPAHLAFETGRLETVWLTTEQARRALLLPEQLQCGKAEHWVPGAFWFTADPTYVPHAKLLTSVSYHEAGEWFAETLAGVTPALFDQMKSMRATCLLRSLDNKALTIGDTARVNGDQPLPIAAIIRRPGVTTLRLTATSPTALQEALNQLYRVLKNFEEMPVSITTQGIRMLLTIQHNLPAETIAQELSAYGTVQCDGYETVLSIIGHNLGNWQGMLGQVFSNMHGIPIRALHAGVSAHRIDLITDHLYTAEAYQQLHQAFFAESLHPVVWLN